MQIRWNFESRSVSSVFEHKDDLKECFKKIINNWEKDKVKGRVVSDLPLA